MAATVIGAATVVIWVYLLFFRAGFWWAPYRSTPIPASVPARSVVAVIPARDEAPVIGRAVASLLAQDYRSDLHIVVMDDQSSDGTAEAARAAAIAARASSRLTVCRGKPVQPSGTGFADGQAELPRPLGKTADSRFCLLFLQTLSAALGSRSRAPNRCRSRRVHIDPNLDPGPHWWDRQHTSRDHR